jgi:hypothetical protein
LLNVIFILKASKTSENDKNDEKLESPKGRNSGQGDKLMFEID